MPLGEVSRERGKFKNLLSVGSHQKTLAVLAVDTSAQLVVWTSDVDAAEEKKRSSEENSGRRSRSFSWDLPKVTETSEEDSCLDIQCGDDKKKKN